MRRCDAVFRRRAGDIIAPLRGCTVKGATMAAMQRREFIGAAAMAPMALALGGGAINVEMWMNDRPFVERIRRAAALGFPAVEFWPWRGKDLEAIKKACDETGIEIAQFTAWGFEPGMNDPKNHEKVVAEIEAACKTAQFLKAKKMCVVGGNDQPGMTQKEMHDNIVAALKLCAPIAEKADVMLILEPMNVRVDHKGHCLYGSPQAVDICRRVGSSHVKINWDLYHMHISEGDLCRRLREGFDQVGYVQLADNPGRNEPGTGEIHYARVMRELWDLGYRGYVGAECVPKKPDVEAARALAACDEF
jgi:hydroxypyruvate isomerase